MNCNPEVPDRIVEQLVKIKGVDAVGQLDCGRFTLYCSAPMSITPKDLKNAGLENPKIANITSVSGDEVNLAIEFSTFWL